MYTTKRRQYNDDKASGRTDATKYRHTLYNVSHYKYDEKQEGSNGDRDRRHE